MNKKQIKISIVFGFLLMAFALFIIKTPFKPEVQSIKKDEIQNNNYQSTVEEKNPKEIKTILEIDNSRIESVINRPVSVYEFMNQLQKEGKLNFKYQTYAGMGKLIYEINGKSNDERNWIYYVNGKKANVGISNYKINPGDVVSWKYELFK